MYVGIDRARGENFAIPSNHFGGGANFQALGDIEAYRKLSLKKYSERIALKAVG